MKKTAKSKTKPPDKKVHLRYKCVNLKFMVVFLTAIGKTPEDFKYCRSTTAQALRLQLRKDNMKVSKAKKVISAFGYHLDIKIWFPNEDPRYIITLPENLKPSEYNLKNIPFLEEIMREHSLSQRKLADKIDGYTNGAVQKWIEKDDMPLKALVNMVKALGLIIEFIITEKK